MSTEESGDDLAALAERVDRAIQAADAQEPPARERARDVRAAIEAFHKEGLTRIVRALKGDPRGREILFELADDPTVYALFSMHGLVREDLHSRVARVLDLVRPYLHSHGGDVELVDVHERTVTVRLTGACHGCSMAATTLRQGVEEALRTHVPEIETVIPTSGTPEGAGFVPLSALRGSAASAASGALGASSGWIEGPRAADVVEGRPTRIETGSESALVLRFGDALYAFRNVCAHQGLPLDGGLVDVEAGTIACPWHGFRFDGRTGECLTAREVQLEPFPLRVEGGNIFVRPT